LQNLPILVTLKSQSRKTPLSRSEILEGPAAWSGDGQLSPGPSPREGRSTMGGILAGAGRIAGPVTESAARLFSACRLLRQGWLARSRWDSSRRPS